MQSHYMVIDSHSEGDPSSVATPLTIRISGRAKLTTTIDPTNMIQCLDELTDNKGYKFVYNGAILSPTLSFSFYNIKDNDLIFAVSPKMPDVTSITPERKVPDMTKQLREYFDKNWAHRVADPDESFKRFQEAADPRTTRENARINDLIRDKQESTPVGYRKICSRLENASLNKQTVFSPSKSVHPPQQSPYSMPLRQLPNVCNRPTPVYKL